MSRPNNPNYSRAGIPVVPIASINAGKYKVARYWAVGKHESSYLMIETHGIGYRLEADTLEKFLREQFEKARKKLENDKKNSCAKQKTKVY